MFYKEYGNRKRFELQDIKHVEDIRVEKKFEKRFFRKRYLYDRNVLKVTLVTFASILKRKVFPII